MLGAFTIMHTRTVWQSANAQHVCRQLHTHLCSRASQDGVLNVTIGEHGTFVLNKQAPNLQMWLSSPVSGPLRYDYVSEKAAWHNTRDQHELLALLASDFETLVGKRIDFSRVVEALREEETGGA